MSSSIKLTFFLIFSAFTLGLGSSEGADSQAKALEHFKKANVLISQQKYAQADKALDKAIKIYPKKKLTPIQRSQLATMHSLRGSCLLRIGKTKAAWKDFNGAVNMDPDAAYPLMMRAVAHSKAGKPDLARKDLKKGLSLKPSPQIKKQMETMLKAL